MSTRLASLVTLCLLAVPSIATSGMSETVTNAKTDSDISLWIDEKQVKQFFNG